MHGNYVYYLYIHLHIGWRGSGVPPFVGLWALHFDTTALRGGVVFQGEKWIDGFRWRVASKRRLICIYRKVKQEAHWTLSSVSLLYFISRVGTVLVLLSWMKLKGSLIFCLISSDKMSLSYSSTFLHFRRWHSPICGWHWLGSSCVGMQWRVCSRIRCWPRRYHKLI